jgi:hypothetical protein
VKSLAELCGFAPLREDPGSGAAFLDFELLGFLLAIFSAAR